MLDPITAYPYPIFIFNASTTSLHPYDVMQSQCWERFGSFFANGPSGFHKFWKRGKAQGALLHERNDYMVHVPVVASCFRGFIHRSYQQPRW